MPTSLQFRSPRAAISALLILVVAALFAPPSVSAQATTTRRIKAPDFPADMEWINTKPLRLKDLKGKFVILDFWTYCCINCMHILPELKKLEHQFPNQLVVIGVHSAKFEAERDSENIREAMLRYEIEHPVVNDSRKGMWAALRVDTWPTVILVDPEGYILDRGRGEFTAASVEPFLREKIEEYRRKDLLSEEPLRIDLDAGNIAPTSLRFPGKVLADAASNRLFIADSNHNRIVVTKLDGTLLETIGSGKLGVTDGGYEEASFNHPQGLALDGEKLYVADTQNHRIRQVNLRTKKVRTVAGNGIQAKQGAPGGAPRQTAIASPWDLWIHDDELYIAMAGPHQIWKMPLSESEIEPYAGNSAEDIVDGPLMPREPFKTGFAAFAQPSGLTSDGEWLYVADSEGSSIRAVPFDPTKSVRTVVGTAHQPKARRLFTFGDRDGTRTQALLQHCLGVAYVNGKIYVADTYNNKLRSVDAKSGETRTLAGLGRDKPGADDTAGTFNEPGGLSYARGLLYIADTNNHLIRTYNLKSGEVRTLPIAGLAPPGAAPLEKPDFEGASQVKIPVTRLAPKGDQVVLKVQLALPRGFKVNPLAKMSYWLDVKGDTGPVDRAALGNVKLTEPTAMFDVPIPVAEEGRDLVSVSLRYSYCSDQDDGTGVCKFGAVVFTVPLIVQSDSEASTALLQHTIN